MFAEMRAFASKHPDVRPQEILEMATVNAAKALKRDGELGVLREGAQADVIAVPFDGVADKVHDALVNFDGPVHASMIDGKWAIPGD
jgi:cytosine/adenosine deaminase-related metal-dependent hydrolase